MSKARIKVSGSLRGELTIAPLNHILKANNVIFIDENEFLSGNVQLAIQKGILLIEFLPDHMKDSVQSSLVKLINKTNKNISLQKSGLSFKSGDSIIVHKNILKQVDVIDALESGSLDTEYFYDVDHIENNEDSQEQKNTDQKDTQNKEDIDKKQNVANEVQQKPKDKDKDKKDSKIKPVSKNKRMLSDVKKPNKPALDVENFDLEAHFIKVQEESLKAKINKENQTNMTSWSPKDGALDKAASTQAVMDQNNAHVADAIPSNIEFIDMSDNQDESDDDYVPFVDVDNVSKIDHLPKKDKIKKKQNNDKPVAKKSDKEILKENKEDFSDAFVSQDTHEDVSFIDGLEDLDDISFVDQEPERISTQKERIADMNEEIS